MREPGVRSPIEALIFSVCRNPLLHLVASVGHSSTCLFVWSKCEDTLSPERVNVTADSCLGDLVVMTLTQNVRHWGSIPR